METFIIPPAENILYKGFLPNRDLAAPRPINPPVIPIGTNFIIPNRIPRTLKPFTITAPTDSPTTTRLFLPETPPIFFPYIIPNRFTLKPVTKTLPTESPVFVLPSTASLASTALPVSNFGPIDLNKTFNPGTKTTNSPSNQFVVNSVPSRTPVTLPPDNNSINRSIIEVLTQLCTSPGFCSNGVYDDCSNQPLTECERCNVGLASVFIFFVIMLGLAIMLRNLIIILVSYQRYKARKMEKLDVCKTSLALADMLTGIQLLTVVVYNFSWTINATPEELDAYELASRSSSKAFLAGNLYLFGFTSSIVHLCYMGGLRFFAIFFPLKFKFVRKTTVIWNLVLVWMFSAVAATAPGWFPGSSYFAYQVSLLLYFPTVESIDGTAAAFVIMSIFYILPYVLMTVLSFATAVRIHQQLRTRKKLMSANPKTISKQDISIFATILIMQTAFTLAMIPTVVVVGMFYNGALDCSNITTPYIVCVYFSMSNSLVNVIIYNIRDGSFRSTIKKTICCCVSSYLVSKDHDISSKQFQLTKPSSSSTSATAKVSSQSQ